MSVTANLTTNVETITATIVVEDETIIVQVSAAARGPAGEAGAAGAAGPNTLTTATTTNLTGFISGDGTNISGATAAATTATANTLVLRSAGGGASFAGLNTNSGSYAQIGGATFNVATTSNANLTTTGSGTVTVSGAGGTTIGGGTLTFSPSGFAYGAGAASAHRTALGLGATGSIAASDPLTLTQTWTDAAVTFTGLQVNVTDSDSAAASLLMDLRVGGASYFQVQKDGRLDAGRYGVVGYYGVRAGSQTGNVFAISRSVDGANVFTVSQGGNITGRGLTVTADGIDIGTSSGSKLINDAANTLAQRNGTAAQESRIYGTYTGPGNYRRLALKMSSAGVAQIVAEGGGSGASGNRIEIDGLRIGKGGSNIATNTALGASALNANTTGGTNTAVGFAALESNTTGSSNSAVGFASLFSNTTGGSNSAVGVSAGRYIANGTTSNAITNNSVYLGADTKALASNQTNQIVIGYNAIGIGSNTAVLGNDDIVTTALKGDVGIGTTSPTERLSVEGNVNATAFIVGNNILTEAADFTLAESHAGRYVRLTKTGSTQTITLPTTGISTGAEFQFYRATTETLAFAGSATVNGTANLASVPNNGAFALKHLGSGTYDFI
jgi:hypothetical protein